MSLAHPCLFPRCTDSRPRNHLTCREHWARASEGQKAKLRALAKFRSTEDLPAAVALVYRPPRSSP